MKHVLALALVLCVISAGPRPADAQRLTEPIPTSEEAASIFEQGLEAFRSGDYGMAYRRFRLASDSYGFNTTTTAALVMAAKSLYRDGRFEQAEELAAQFVRRYPSSSYVAEAERVAAFAREQMEAQQRRSQVFQLGVALPLSGAADVTQSMFNGIRLAVDAHNRASGDVMPVRMVFRDTHGDPSTAREVVAELAREGVDVIIGPIFSDEARAAAQEAERREVVMIAPLATDEDVAAGRRYVFQANPPLTTRGRVMARQALRDGADGFGIIARLGDSVGERMAEGFQDEVLSRGANVEFYELLDSNGEWGRLPEVIGRDTLGDAGALYLALAGAGSRSNADAAMRSLLDAGLTPRIYGGDGWHDLGSASTASQFQTIYGTDFFSDPHSSGVREFENQYQALADQASDRPAFTGYDVSTFVLTRKLSGGNAPMRDLLHDGSAYQGLGIRIDFSRGNVNEALFIFGYRDGRIEPLR